MAAFVCDSVGPTMAEQLQRTRAAHLCLALLALPVMAAMACHPDEVVTPTPNEAPVAAPVVEAAPEAAKEPTLAELLPALLAAGRLDGAGPEQAAPLIDPILAAAARHFTNLKVAHEVKRAGDVAEIRIAPNGDSALNRLAAALQRDAETALIYDLGEYALRTRPPPGYDEMTNTLRLTHAAVLFDDVDEPELLHARARAEIWATLRRGEASPYYGTLVESNYEKSRHQLDALHADAADLERWIRRANDVVAAATDADLAAADLAAVLAARRAGAPSPRALTAIEAPWDRAVTAALVGSSNAARLAGSLAAAKASLRGTSKIQYEPAARGVRAALPIDGAAGHAGYTLSLDLNKSTGAADPQNPILFRGQLLLGLAAAERHREHFNAVLGLLDKIAAAPADKRKAMLRALVVVAAPVSSGGVGAKAAEGYRRRFDKAITP